MVFSHIEFQTSKGTSLVQLVLLVRAEQCLQPGIVGQIACGVVLSQNCGKVVLVINAKLKMIALCPHQLVWSHSNSRLA